MEIVTYDNNQSVIYVRYQNPVVEYRISYVNYDLQSWISEIGGTIGLTLGISGLSLVEVVSDARLGAEMFGMGDFWLEIRVIIKISSHP